jgi:hypothetical protein
MIDVALIGGNRSIVTSDVATITSDPGLVSREVVLVVVLEVVPVFGLSPV